MYLTKEEILKNKKPIPKSALSGVYFLINNNEIVYIGSSYSILNRVTTHLKENKIIFDNYFYIVCKDYLIQESKYILIFKPKFNKAINSCFSIKYGLWAPKHLKILLRNISSSTEGPYFYLYEALDFLKNKLEDKSIIYRNSTTNNHQYRLYKEEDVENAMAEFFHKKRGGSKQFINSLKQMENMKISER